MVLASEAFLGMLRQWTKRTSEPPASLAAQSSQIAINGQLFFARDARHRFARTDEIGQLDAVEFTPDVGQPVADIAAQHERVVRRLVIESLVGDEFEERHRATSTCS